jgi:uncharacterized NAD-dependent epimerase/dehydratase family protein
MTHKVDGDALVYCEGAFGTTNGKTAHGLVRRTTRYNILGVIDSRRAGSDAGEVLDGRPARIPIYADLTAALEACQFRGQRPTHLVVGLAPDGGRLSDAGRAHVLEAVQRGLHVDSGLHDILSDDPEIAGAAAERNVRLRDMRKLPPRAQMHFFSGKIEQVRSLKVALLGTDSAVGKRTAAWILVDGLCARGLHAELVGTGQTAWLQGARYGIVLDSLINDFVSGEIEHAVHSCYVERRPDVIVIEGQGSMMNPAYPGGFEILAAGRPDVVVLQHAPGRKDYDGFPGYPIHPLTTQIEAVQLISGRPVVAVTINHEGLDLSDLPALCAEISESIGLPVCDPLVDGCEAAMDALLPHFGRREMERND